MCTGHGRITAAKKKKRKTLKSENVNPNNHIINFVPVNVRKIPKPKFGVKNNKRKSYIIP